jgi:hypothetical protein
MCSGSLWAYRGVLLRTMRTAVKYVELTKPPTHDPTFGPQGRSVMVRSILPERSSDGGSAAPRGLQRRDPRHRDHAARHRDSDPLYQRRTPRRSPSTPLAVVPGLRALLHHDWLRVGRASLDVSAHPRRRPNALDLEPRTDAVRGLPSRSRPRSWRATPSRSRRVPRRPQSSTASTCW